MHHLKSLQHFIVVSLESSKHSMRLRNPSSGSVTSYAVDLVVVVVWLGTSKCYSKQRTSRTQVLIEIGSVSAYSRIAVHSQKHENTLDFPSFKQIFSASLWFIRR